MDQNEIDRIALGILDSSPAESKSATPPASGQPEAGGKTEMIDQLDKVTQVT